MLLDTLLLRILGNAIELISLLVLFSILDNRKYPYKKTLQLYAVYLMIHTVVGTAWSTVHYESYQKFVTVTLLAGSILFLPFTSRSNMFQVIYNIALQFFLLIFQIIAATGLSMFFFDGNPWIDLAVRLLYLAVVVLIYIRTVQKPFRSLRGVSRRTWISFSLIAVVDCLYIVILGTRPAFILTRGLWEIAMFSLVWLLFLLTHIVIIRSLYAQEQLSLAKQTELQRNLLLAQVEAQRKLTEEARRLRHDERHHNIVIAGFAKNGDVEGLLDYIGEWEKSLDHSVIYCENKALNHIITCYANRASELGINISITAQARQRIAVSSTDFVAIVANILENAIRGCLDSHDEKSFIRLNIHEKSDKLVIRCENSCRKSLSFSTLPEQLRGIGISSIEDAAAHYEGDCDFSAENGVFLCGVLLNLPCEE